MRFKSTHGTVQQFAMSCEGTVEFHEITRLPQDLCVSSANRNSIPAPRSNTILRLYSANSENGPDASMCATLTRQRKGSPLAGTRIASWVMPPPFFQGVAVKEALRMTCSLEFCTPVFYTVLSISCGPLSCARRARPLTHEINP